MSALAHYYFQHDHPDQVEILIPKGRETLLREVASIVNVLSVDKTKDGLLVKIPADLEAIKEISPHCDFTSNAFHGIDFSKR